MAVPLWLFLAVLAWAVLVSVFLFYRNPLPFPDRGHRCFPVPNEEAAKTVITILGEIGGLPERFTFDSGSVRQTILWDNATAIMQFGPATRELGIPLSGVSVVVDRPRVRAEEAAVVLKQRGFSARVVQDVDPDIGDKLVILVSDAFEGWVMVFRRHGLAMGKPRMWKLLRS